MIPFYQNNSNAPSTREEAGLIIIWMLHRMDSPHSVSQLLSPLLVTALNILVTGGVSLSSSVDRRLGYFHFHFSNFPTSRLAGARASHNSTPLLYRCPTIITAQRERAYLAHSLIL